MTKRKLADRILDEILTLRRPKGLVLEFDEHQTQEQVQDRVLEQSDASPGPASRRQIIVEQ